MEKPDKIYVIEKEATRGNILYATEELNEFAAANNPSEYIHKDALIKLAKDINKTYVKCGYGEKGFYELVNKIKEL